LTLGNQIGGTNGGKIKTNWKKGIVCGKVTGCSGKKRNRVGQAVGAGEKFVRWTGQGPRENPKIVVYSKLGWRTTGGKVLWTKGFRMRKKEVAQAKCKKASGRQKLKYSQKKGQLMGG